MRARAMEPSPLPAFKQLLFYPVFGSIRQALSMTIRHYSDSAPLDAAPMDSAPVDSAKELFPVTIPNVVEIYKEQGETNGKT